MKISIRAALMALTLCGLAAAVPGVSLAQTPGAGAAPSGPDSLPAWAYVWDPDFQVPPADDEPHRVPASVAAFSWKQARDLFFSPDWHPDDHAAMPTIVASGRKPDVRACGSCHRAEGTGGPENASLAGLPVAYFVQQMADIKSGARKFSTPPDAPGNLFMKALAKEMTQDEVMAAANYFASLKPARVIKVVEADTIPKTYIARLFFVRSPDGGTESLGRRIVEMPDDVERFELRDSRVQFTAYVPLGSVAKGEALAKTGGDGTTVACATCHGRALKGVGFIPPIAGRSPTYVVRQLYDFRYGARAGPNSLLMKEAVAKLSEEDMIALAAYVGSLAP